MVKLVDNPGLLSMVIDVAVIIMAVVFAFIDAACVVLSQLWTHVDTDRHGSLMNEILESSCWGLVEASVFDSGAPFNLLSVAGALWWCLSLGVVGRSVGNCTLIRNAVISYPVHSLAKVLSTWAVPLVAALNHLLLGEVVGVAFDSEQEGLVCCRSCEGPASVTDDLVFNWCHAAVVYPIPLFRGRRNRLQEQQ